MNERIRQLRRAHLEAWEAAAAESLLRALGWSEPGRDAEAMRVAQAATEALAAESLQEATMGENHTYTAFLQPGKHICVQCGRDTGDGSLVGHTCLPCFRANGFRQFQECQP